jgi:hypothetical protein
MLASLILTAEAGAVSMEMDERPVAAKHAVAQGALPLKQDALAPEPALGVLHIPIDEPVIADESARQRGSQGSDSGARESASLGFARVPLPAAAWLFGTAVVGIIAVSRRRPGRQFG